LACGATLVAGEPPTLVPPPQELKWSAELPVKLAPDSVAIVLGAQASDPEQQAARLLAEAVMTRFGQHWPVIREGEEQPAQRSLIILGQRTTCRRLDKLCQEQGIDLSNTSPGLDG
jgi:transposase